MQSCIVIGDSYNVIPSDFDNAVLGTKPCIICGEMLDFIKLCGKKQHWQCYIKLRAEEVRDLLESMSGLEEMINIINPPVSMRSCFIRSFWQNNYKCWSLLPNYNHLQELERTTGLSGYLEIGSGCGLLAAIMQKYGFKFVAVTDNNTGIFSAGLSASEEEPIFFKPYCDIEQLDCVDATKKYKANVLLTSWAQDYSYSDICDYFQGKYIVHIGEGLDGCTDFGEIPDNEWMLVKIIYIPRWYGYKDRVEIYERI